MLCIYILIMWAYKTLPAKFWGLFIKIRPKNNPHKMVSSSPLFWLVCSLVLFTIKHSYMTASPNGSVYHCATPSATQSILGL